MRRDNFEFLLGWRPDEPWADFVRTITEIRRGVGVPDGYVRAAQLAAQVGNDLVGRVSIRFELNDFLALRGGHIGFGVLPAYRRRGYATDILRQALVLAGGEGVSPVLLTCDDDNHGSAAVIERCGGVLESVRESSPSDKAFRRYWIQ